MFFPSHTLKCITTSNVDSLSDPYKDPGLLEYFEKLIIQNKIDSEELRLLILHLSPSSEMNQTKTLKLLVSRKIVSNDLAVF